MKPMTSDLRGYYQLISAIGKQAMKQKKAEGETMHLAPLGYRNVHHDGRSVIEPDPTTHALVEQALRLCDQGISIRQICREMEKLGLRSQRGKIIGPASMLKILRRGPTG